MIQANQQANAGTMPLVLCCMCGVTMQSNAANTCAQCLQTQFDITSGLTKGGIICRCKGCERYQRDSTGWLACGRESRDLLAFCLKKIKGLKTVKLVDAIFIWTEEHSKRIKLKLTVQKEVINGVVLQQTCVIEFVEQNRMCEDCHRSEANITWNSVVQVRQKVSHKRTFLYLEQLILKHNACDRALKIAPMPFGVDFFFASVGDAVRFEDFLSSVVPMKYKRSKKIISMDIKSNEAHFNHTFSVEIVPICKDDLVCLPLSTAKKLGNISQVVLCTQVNSTVRLIDPKSCQICELQTEYFWQHPFRSLASAKQLTQFVVLDVEAVEDGGVALDSLPSLSAVDSNSVGEMSSTTVKSKKRRAGDARSLSDHRMRSRKHQLCDVTVAKLSDFGVNDDVYITRSHLGFVLNPGDSVLGYDVRAVNFTHADTSDLRQKEEESLPDFILVRKYYPKFRAKKRTRLWKLKALAREAPDTPGVGVGASIHDNKDDEKDFEMFLQDIEEDKEMRSKMNLYKDERVQKKNRKLNGIPEAESNLEDEVEEDAPKVELDELLEEMQLEEEEQMNDDDQEEEDPDL